MLHIDDPLIPFVVAVFDSRNVVISQSVVMEALLDLTTCFLFPVLLLKLLRQNKAKPLREFIVLGTLLFLRVTRAHAPQIGENGSNAT